MSTFQMPFYFIKTVSQAEKDAWIKQAQDEATKYFYQGNTISATFEPVKGWRPFAKYGTNPVEIIHNCIQDYDNTVGKILFRKDRLLYLKDKFHLFGRIADFNFYKERNPRNALIVPKHIGGKTSVYNIMNNPTDYPDSALADSYKDYYNKFPTEVKQYVLSMDLPYVNTIMHIGRMQAYVFPPAVNEVPFVPSPYPSLIIAGAFTNIDVSMAHPSTSPKAVFFWTRDSYNDGGMGQITIRMTDEERMCVWQRIDSERALFPCFCIG